jgi:hypothetical protein
LTGPTNEVGRPRAVPANSAQAEQPPRGRFDALERNPGRHGQDGDIGPHEQGTAEQPATVTDPIGVDGAPVGRCREPGELIVGAVFTQPVGHTGPFGGRCAFLQEGVHGPDFGRADPGWLQA